MKLYRILTENKNYTDVAGKVSEYFPGFTLIKAEGYWQGQAEQSLIIEIVADESDIYGRIDWICRWIKEHNEQQAVMLQVLNVDSQLI